MTDWTDCPDVERIPGKVSGAWLMKGTRIRIEDVLTNAADQTPEQIATEVYEGLDVAAVRRVIAFAAMMAIAKRAAQRPVFDPRRPEEIIGYNALGLLAENDEP
jgi:uncharacterized protein (DUF433 family)